MGQLVSVSGTWIQWMAQSWLVVNSLGGHGVELGTVAALLCGPMLVGGLWGGLVADRFDKRTLLRWTNALQALLSGALGALAITGTARLWQIYAFAFAFGVVMVVDMPARKSIVIEIVGLEEVPNAVALNTVLINAGRLVGPPVAAALIALFRDNTGPAFFANSVTFLVAFVMISRMDPSTMHAITRMDRARGQVREGLRHIARTPALRETLVLMAALTVFGFNFIVVLPLMATFTFGGGAGIYGLFSSVMAAGAIVGALTMASRRPTRRLLLGLALAFGGVSVLAAYGPSILVESAILAGVGFASMAFLSTANSTLQLNAPDAMRGRVMAAYVLISVGANTVGGPLIGWIAQAMSPRSAFLFGGTASIAAAAAVHWWQRRVRIAPQDPDTAAAATVDFGGEAAPAGR